MQYSSYDSSDDDYASSNISSGSANEGMVTPTPKTNHNSKTLKQSLRRLLLDAADKNSGSCTKDDSESDTNERVNFGKANSSERQSTSSDLQLYPRQSSTRSSNWVKRDSESDTNERANVSKSNSSERQSTSSDLQFYSRQSSTRSFNWADCDFDFDFDDIDAMEPPSANLMIDDDGTPTTVEDDSNPVPSPDPSGPYDEEKHNAGDCKPCLYILSKAGCRNGEDCNFCHLPHRKQVRNRPCKATRVQCKKIADMLERHVQDPEQRLEFTDLLGARSPYTKLLLKGKQRGTSSSEYDSEAASSSDANSQY